jgi:hypothetical protein
MKFKYITLLFLFSVSTLSAQTYQIFRTTGSVTHYHNKQWAAAQRRATVLLSDSINIGQNSSCTLLNTQNNQLIDLKNSGKYQAKKIIDLTIRESSNVIAQTTQNIANAVSSTGKTKNYNIYGATMRAEETTIQTNKALALQLSKVISNMQQGKTIKPSKTLSLQRTIVGDTFTFTVQNNANCPYVFNILRIPKQGAPAFCFNLDKTDSEYFFLLIDANATLTLNQTWFALDDATYILVGTEDIFDATWVANALSTTPSKEKTKKIAVELSPLQP